MLRVMSGKREEARSKESDRNSCAKKARDACRAGLLLLNEYIFVVCGEFQGDFDFHHLLTFFLEKAYVIEG
jgi:hypothetical protein